LPQSRHRKIAKAKKLPKVTGAGINAAPNPATRNDRNLKTLMIIAAAALLSAGGYWWSTLVVSGGKETKTPVA
jgi:hypothetical protein